ncbi:MAG: hypothetical protein WEB30_02520 [Cyclobacteriaceae bacterium]
MTNNPMSIKKILFAAFTLFIFSQCTEEEIVPARAEAPAVEMAALPAPAGGSMTISGIHTTYEPIKDCTTCTFVVPANMAVVDGKELDLKAGSVICLEKAIQYGDVDFINLEGTEDNPIKIGVAELNKK